MESAVSRGRGPDKGKRFDTRPGVFWDHVHQGDLQRLCCEGGWRPGVAQGGRVMRSRLWPNRQSADALVGDQGIGDQSRAWHKLTSDLRDSLRAKIVPRTHHEDALFPSPRLPPWPFLPTSSPSSPANLLHTTSSCPAPTCGCYPLSPATIILASVSLCSPRCRQIPRDPYPRPFNARGYDGNITPLSSLRVSSIFTQHHF